MVEYRTIYVSSADGYIETHLPYRSEFSTDARVFFTKAEALAYRDAERSRQVGLPPELEVRIAAARGVAEELQQIADAAVDVAFRAVNELDEQCIDHTFEEELKSLEQRIAAARKGGV
jgi:hypothetical protein